MEIRLEIIRKPTLKERLLSFIFGEKQQITVSIPQEKEKTNESQERQQTDAAED